MKLQFEKQKFQKEAAKAVVDVFEGQPNNSSSYLIDRGDETQNTILDFTGWNNYPLVKGLNDKILENIQKIQRTNHIAPSDKLEGENGINLTIEMETGVGKTYTYIKTMYELNKAYGWSKFIIVVPSIAIREGVYKSFEMTKEHFQEEYGEQIRFFIYNSSNITEIDNYAKDSFIHAMIINSQAFNATGKDARKIFQKLDELQSRKPIDIIAKTNPILIIDEPQSVEGKKTKENLKQFNPIITLRYSATHKKDSIYNMVYRLDAMDAYNKKLVKKIAVKGITQEGSTATEGFVYLQSINLSKENPTATIQFDCKTKKGIKQVTKTVGEGFDLFQNSGELPEYENNYVIKFIDGRDDSIEFINGIKVYAGEARGEITEEQIRRIQISETIAAHLERERLLFNKGIKVLSLFFIDEVANYRQYDAAGQPQNGIYADIFEEEYEKQVSELQISLGEEGYIEYLDSIKAHDTHAGYFSIDNKGHMTNSSLNNKKEQTSDDVSAYDLIMKNKELLLDRDPKKSPVRFIFSHSALREGWDNPNVFQICTLKQSGSEVRKRQEVGRGLRLCVNQDGVRMDVNELKDDVHNINVLTVIASESYEKFAKGLQDELAEAVSDRPKQVSPDLFNCTWEKEGKDSLVVGPDLATTIFLELALKGYVDSKTRSLTDKYYEDKKNNSIELDVEEIVGYEDVLIEKLDSIYNPSVIKVENSRKNNVEAKVDKNKLESTAFQELWKRINQKTAFRVNFNSKDLVNNCIAALNEHLNIPKIYYVVETGEMKEIKSKEALQNGESMKSTKSEMKNMSEAIGANPNVKYDLVGRLVEETTLTRKDLVEILTGIRKDVFEQFKNNPENFIIKAAELINDQKAKICIDNIQYYALDETYGTDIFTTKKGRLGVNAMKVNKSIYDHVIYDSSTVEKPFAEKIDVADAVEVYVKLPSEYVIPTPVGDYNPDWAIAFKESTNDIQHIYFVAETKGTSDDKTIENHITPNEQAKIDCGKKHYETISKDKDDDDEKKKITYGVVSSYNELLTKVLANKSE